MNCQVNAYQVNPKDMDDATLVEFSQTYGDKEVEAELVMRYFDRACGIIQRLGLSTNLNVQDLEDAKQDSVFALLKAIKRFDPTKRCSFATFLHRVVTDRFRDFCKHTRRANRRFGYNTYVGSHRSGDEDDSRLSFESNVSDRPDRQPPNVCQWRETLARLHSTMNDLDEPMQRFLRSLLRKDSLRSAAMAVGFSYDKAKRARRRLQSEMLRILECV